MFYGYHCCGGSMLAWQNKIEQIHKEWLKDAKIKMANDKAEAARVKLGGLTNAEVEANRRAFLGIK